METILKPETIPIPTPFTLTIKSNLRIGITNLYYNIYRTRETRYIITYISEYPIALDSKIYDIVDLIRPHYKTTNIAYSNVCGPNTEYICSNIHIPEVRFGVLSIYDWMPEYNKNMKIIELIYGNPNYSIGATYHALSYAKIRIDTNILYVAIETTICHPYQLQFYVGNTMEELTTIICERYQCTKFYITFDCNDWFRNITNEYIRDPFLGFGNKKSKTHKRKSIRKKKTYKISKPQKNKNAKKR